MEKQQPKVPAYQQEKREQLGMSSALESKGVGKSATPPPFQPGAGSGFDVYQLSSIKPNGKPKVAEYSKGDAGGKAKNPQIVNQGTNPNKKLGTPPNDNNSPIGWPHAQLLRATKKEKWVRFHLITQEVGGPGDKENLVPTLSAVNTGNPWSGYESKVRNAYHEGMVNLNAKQIHHYRTNSSNKQVPIYKKPNWQPQVGQTSPWVWMSTEVQYPSSGEPGFPEKIKSEAEKFNESTNSWDKIDQVEFPLFQPEADDEKRYKVNIKDMNQTMWRRALGNSMAADKAAKAHALNKGLTGGPLYGKIQDALTGTDNKLNVQFPGAMDQLELLWDGTNEFIEIDWEDSLDVPTESPLIQNDSNGNQSEEEKPLSSGDETECEDESDLESKMEIDSDNETNSKKKRSSRCNPNNPKVNNKEDSSDEDDENLLSLNPTSIDPKLGHEYMDLDTESNNNTNEKKQSSNHSTRSNHFSNSIETNDNFNKGFSELNQIDDGDINLNTIPERIMVDRQPEIRSKNNLSSGIFNSSNPVNTNLTPKIKLLLNKKKRKDFGIKRRTNPKPILNQNKKGNTNEKRKFILKLRLSSLKSQTRSESQKLNKMKSKINKAHNKPKEGGKSRNHRKIILKFGGKR